jgi:hypothetical protein
MRTQYVQTTSEFAGQRMPLDVLVVDENSNDLEYHAELFEKLGLRVFRCASYRRPSIPSCGAARLILRSSRLSSF